MPVGLAGGTGAGAPGKSGLSIQTNFSWMLFANVFYAGCQWAMLVVIAKVGNPEMVGRFVLGLAVSAPVMMFSELNLRLVLATDSRCRYSFPSYLALRLVTSPLAVLVIAAIALLAGYAPETAAIVIVIGMAKAIEAVSDIYHGLYQFHERLDYMAKSLMLGGLLALLLLAAVLVVSGSVLWAAAGLVVAQAARLAAYNVPSARSVLRRAGIASGPAIRASLMPHWDAGLLWQLALLTLPLGVMALLQSLNTNIPRFFIERDLGPHALGIFAALAYVMVAGTTIVRALGQAASPVMARLFNGRQWRRFFWHCGILMAAGIAIGLAGIGIAVLAGRRVLALIYTPEYSGYVPLFVNIMVAALFLYVGQFLDYCVTIVRRFRAQMALALMVGGLTLVLSAWLVPRAGLLGASQALLWGGVARVVGNLAILAHGARAAAAVAALGPPAVDVPLA